MNKNLFIIIYILLIGSLPAVDILVQLPGFKQTAEAIIGKDSKVSVLMGPGSNPHTFSMAPADLKKVITTDVYIMSSLKEPVNEKLIKILKERNPKALIVSAEDLLLKDGDLIKNPHNWLSLRAHELIAQHLAEEFSKKTPANKAAIAERKKLFLAKIAHVKSEIKAKLKSCQGKTFYTGHAVFTYFAAANKLTERGIATGGKTPTARLLFRLIKSAKKEGVKLIIVQKQFNPRAGRLVANSIKGEVLELDHLQEDVFSLLLNLADSLQRSYGKK